MVETHFIKRSRRSIRGDVTADVVLDAVRAHYHGQRVPADQTLDAALEFLVAGKKGLQARGNRVRVRSMAADRQIEAVDRSVGAEPLQDFRGHLRSAGFQNGIQRLKPFLNLYVFHAMGLGRYFVVHNFGWFLVFLFAGWTEE